MRTSQAPKYLALARYFQQRIRSGELRPGDRLPSFKQMRARFGATPSTVERLYAQLERENLIERHHRRGVFVAGAPGRSTLQGTLGFAAVRFSGPQLHPYNHYLLQGIQQAARAAGVQILLLDRSDINANRNKIDGLLIYEHELGPFAKYRAEGVPCVSLVKRADEIPSVVADDFKGGKSATEYLLALGHTRIAALVGTAAGDIHDALGALRLEGYRAALREAGIAPETRFVRPVLYNPLENYAERGHSLMRRWLREDWHELGCTAILAQNDNVAIGIIRALREDGREVPRDVSVVGFDGAGADMHFAPRLTTVEVPLQEIGARGTQLLLQQIGGERDVQHLVLPTKLRTGQSSAPSGVLAEPPAGRL